MKINLTFLGTSAVVPTKSRNHTSILLSYKSENILIDCGEGTQRQFRKAKINPCKITKILITHWHGDHVLGLPGLIQTLALNNYSKTLDIYGPKGTKKFVKELFKVFILAEKIKIETHEVSGKFFENPDFKLIAYPLKHDAPTNGYILQEKDKLRINKNKLEKLLNKLKLNKKDLNKLSKLTEGKNIKINNQTIKAKSITFEQKGKKISFIFDTKLTPSMKKLAKDSDLTIIEATYLASSDNGNQLASEYKHLTAEQAAKTAKQNKAKKLILTHFSQRYENKEKLLLKEAKKIFPNTVLAEDLMKLEI